MSSPHAVGVDVGGTHAKIVVVSTAGDIHAERRIDTGPAVRSAALAPALLGAVEEAAGSIGIALHELAALGLVVPGFVDAQRTRSAFSPNTPGLLGGDLPFLLAQGTGLAVTFDSDVNAAAFGEAAWGEGRGIQRMLTMTMGTGVGGGLVVDGALVRISGGTVGDIGHVILEPGGRRCTAGCAGCAEALIGAGGLVEMARREGADASVDRPSLVISAARAGESWAVRVAHRAGSVAGILLASLMPILTPDRVAIVGGTALLGTPFFDSLREAVAANGGQPYTAGRAIVPGRFASLAGAVGAAALALREGNGVAGD